MTNLTSTTQFLLLFVLVAFCDAFRFHLPPDAQKCLKEEIHKNVLVTGEYELSAASNQKTSLTVTDSKGHILFTKEDASKGKFAFTTEEDDIFSICFDNKQVGRDRSGDREVYLDVKRGVEAKSYAELAKAEKLKPLEAELKRLEDLAEAVVSDFAYMKAREEEMRDTNESTHARVTYLSIFSISCLFALAIWQTLYLRRYFKSKKLID